MRVVITAVVAGSSKRKKNELARMSDAHGPLIHGWPLHEHYNKLTCKKYWGKLGKGKAVKMH